MSSSLDLRRLMAPEYERRLAVARWQRDGLAVHLCQPQPQTCYIAFWAQGSQGIWQGMIAPGEWLDKLWPQWPQMLPQGCTDQEILQLLSTLERPVDVGECALDYHRLIELELTQGESLQGAHLPCIATPAGTLWVLGLPGHYQPPARPFAQWVQELPHVMRVVLGYSELGLHQQRKLAAGDVLLIAEQTPQLIMLDHCIAHFTFIEEGLYMHLNSEEGEALSAPSVLSALPVRLEFVLQEMTLTLAQLNDLIDSQVLPLEPTAASHVEVRAAGKVIAIGELVQLDGRLGVELREISRGPGNE